MSFRQRASGIVTLFIIACVLLVSLMLMIDAVADNAQQEREIHVLETRVALVEYQP